jgi:hypothetical protein
MGRRDGEQLPPVEVLGAAGRISSLQEVSTRGPDGPRGRRGLGLIVGAGVVGLLVAGLLLGDDEVPAASEREEETTTTTRSRPTTTRPRPTSTTTTTLPGPLFAGHVVRGWLLSGNANGWTLVDIESGAELETGLPFDNPYSTRPVAGGVVLISSGEARFYDLRVPAEVREPVRLGLADQILTTAEGDQVWLVEGATETRPDDARARLVDLGGRELRSFPVPPEPFPTFQGGPFSPIAGTPEGVLFGRGGRVYLVNEAGVQAVGIGDLVGAVESSVLVFTCDQAAFSCGIDLRTTSGARIRRLDVERSSPLESVTAVSSADDGRFAVVQQSYSSNGDTSVITLFDADGRSTATVQVMGYMSNSVGWLPNDAGLVGTRNGRIVWIHPTSDGWVVEDLPGMSVQSEGVLALAAP